MAENKCPMCESPCIIKIITTGDSRYSEVDVCRTCGTMYPRGKNVKPASKKAAKKPTRKPAKKARKK